MTATLSEVENLQARLRALTDRSLSPLGRYAHVALLLAAAGMGAVVLALLLTEPDLPLRTRLAFGALLVVAASWVGYAGWVLTHRRPLFQGHRVIAGGLATAFSGAFAAVAAAVALTTGAPAAVAASGIGCLMLVAALVLLQRARAQRRTLQARRDALQAELDALD